MDSCYNSSNVYYEESSGEKTTDVAVASGIIGTYYGINKIKFDTCVNMGEIYSKSGSVGGIISSVAKQIDYFSDTIEQLTLPTIVRSELMVEGTSHANFIGNGTIDDNAGIGSTRKLAEVVFERCLNVSNAIGGNKQRTKWVYNDKTYHMQSSRYAGGLYGYAEDVDITINSCIGQGNITAVHYDIGQDSYAGGLAGVTKLHELKGYTPKLITSTKAGYEFGTKGTYNMLDQKYIMLDKSVIKNPDNNTIGRDETNGGLIDSATISADYAGGLFGYIKSENALQGHISENQAVSNRVDMEENIKISELKDQANNPDLYELYNSNIGRFVSGGNYMHSGLSTVKGMIATSGAIAKFDGDSRETLDGNDTKHTTLVLTNIWNWSKVVGDDMLSRGEHDQLPNNSGASGIISETTAVYSLYFDNCINAGVIDGSEIYSEVNGLSKPKGSNAGGFIATVSKTDNEGALSNKNKDNKIINNFKYLEFDSCTIHETAKVMSTITDYSENLLTSVGGLVGYINTSNASDNFQLRIVSAKGAISGSENAVSAYLKSSGVNSGAGGLIGYLNVSNKVEIQGGENGYNVSAKVYSDSNSGVLIGNLEANGKTYISNYSVGGSIKNESSKESNGAGGFIGRVNNLATDVSGSAKGELFIYNEEDYANNESSTTVDANKKAGGIIGLISNTKAIISIGRDDEGAGSTIKLSQTISSKAYAGGVIGSVAGNCDYTNLTIMNIEMIGGVYGATSGGVIGHIDVEGGNNRIVIGGDSKDNAINVGSIVGNNTTETAGGVIGHLKAFAANELSFGTITVGSKTAEKTLGTMTKYKIESTKNLGGVIGISYTASLPSTTNISLNKIEFSIINEQESPQTEWIFSKERGLQLVRVEEYTVCRTYKVDEAGKKVPNSEKEAKRTITDLQLVPDTKSLKYNTLRGFNFKLMDKM